MRKRKSKKTKLQDEADMLTQKKYVAENPYCLICGKPTNCMHHYIPKSLSKALRYDPDNLIPVCFGCHMAIHQKSDPYPTNRIVEIKGTEWRDNLEKKRRQPFKQTIGYLESIIEFYKRDYAE